MISSNWIEAVSTTQQFYFRHIHPNRWRKNSEGNLRITSDVFTDGDNAVSLWASSGTTPQKVMDEYQNKSVGLAIISGEEIDEVNARVRIDDDKGHATMSYLEAENPKDLENRATSLRDFASQRGLLLFCYIQPLLVFPPCEEIGGEPPGEIFDPNIEYS